MAVMHRARMIIRACPSVGRGRAAARARRGQQGMALIVVLWVMAFLMFIVVEFSYTMRVETDTVRNLKDETSARYLALAGLNMGLAEIGSDYDVVFMGKGQALAFGKKEGHDLRTIDVKRDMDLGAGHLRYTISDEEGKLNINASSREKLMNLLRVTGVDMTDRDEIADSILDWRDANHEFHMNGAEDDYYGSLPHPYGARDGDFELIDELLLVKGVTPEIFYGTGRVPPGFSEGADGEARKARLPGASDRVYRGLSDLLTTEGDGRVNINTAPPEVLEAMLGKGRSMEILLRRQTEGYFEWPMYGGAITSRFFSIESEGEVHGMRVRVRAIAERLQDRAGARVIYMNDNVTLMN